MVTTSLLQANRIPIFMDDSFDMHEKKRQSSSNMSSQGGIQGKNKEQKDMENAEVKSLHSTETASTFNKPEINSTRFTQKGTPERRQNFASDRKAKPSTQRAPRSNQKDTNVLPVKEMQKQNKFETEIRNSNRKFAQNQRKAQTGFGLSKKKVYGQPEMIHRRQKPERKEQKLGVNGLHKKDQEQNEAARISMKEDQQLNHETQQYHTRKSVTASEDVHSIITGDHDNLNDDVIFTDNQPKDKAPVHNLISKVHGVGAESEKSSNAPPLKEDKYVQVKTSMITVPKSKMQNRNCLKMVDQVTSRHADLPQNFNSPPEQQSTFLKETEFQHDDTRYSKYFAGDSSRCGTQPLQSTMKPPLNRAVIPSALQKPDLTDITQGIALQASSHEHAPLCKIENTRESIACSTQSKEAGLVGIISSEIPDHLQAMANNTRKTKKLDPLNEEETKLKCMLFLSPHFLNIARTLFKLNIPVNILQADKEDNDDAKHIHMLEAVYDIMKRKAIRQELKVNPFTKSSIGCPKVGSLQDLVKQLHKVLETLKCYGGVWGEDTGAYLLKMVERDMYCTDPDINCMWEYSWNASSFAFVEKDETIQELEKSILDDLMDDIFQGF